MHLTMHLLACTRNSEGKEKRKGGKEKWITMNTVALTAGEIYRRYS